MEVWFVRPNSAFQKQRLVVFYLNSYYLHLFLYLLLWYTLLFFENVFLSQRRKEKSESNQSDGTYYIKRNETNKFVEQ